MVDYIVDQMLWGMRQEGAFLNNLTYLTSHIIPFEYFKITT